MRSKKSLSLVIATTALMSCRIFAADVHYTAAGTPDLSSLKGQTYEEVARAMGNSGYNIVTGPDGSVRAALFFMPPAGSAASDSHHNDQRGDLWKTIRSHLTTITSDVATRVAPNQANLAVDAASIVQANASATHDSTQVRNAAPASAATVYIPGNYRPGLQTATLNQNGVPLSMLVDKPGWVCEINFNGPKHRVSDANCSPP